MGDRRLSRISFNCFWILFHESTALTVIEYFPYLFVLKKSFIRLPCVELKVSCWSEEKLNQVLKIDGDKLFRDLLTNKIFSMQILSWNFKMEFCLNRGLVWKFLGWRLITLMAFFCKIIMEVLEMMHKFDLLHGFVTRELQIW